jgi:hypothetical protein
MYPCLVDCLHPYPWNIQIAVIVQDGCKAIKAVKDVGDIINPNVMSVIERITVGGKRLIVGGSGTLVPHPEGVEK